MKENGKTPDPNPIPYPNSHEGVSLALEKLGIPLVGGLSQEKLVPFVVVWRQRIFDFKPEKRAKPSIELGPPSLSAKQEEILDGWPVGRVHTKNDIGCSISSLRSLVNKGYLEVVGEEEAWKRIV